MSECDDRIKAHYVGFWMLIGLIVTLGAGLLALVVALT